MTPNSAPNSIKKHSIVATITTYTFQYFFLFFFPHSHYFLQTGMHVKYRKYSLIARTTNNKWKGVIPVEQKIRYKTIFRLNCIYTRACHQIWNTMCIIVFFYVINCSGYYFKAVWILYCAVLKYRQQINEIFCTWNVSFRRFFAILFYFFFNN